MNIEIFTLCEFASLRAGQTVICNTFNTWNTLGDASLVTGFAVIQVRVRANEAGRHTLQLEIVTADGVSAGRSPEMSFTPAFISDDMETYAYCTAIPLHIELPLGQHEARLMYDGEERMAIPLCVHKVS